MFKPANNSNYHSLNPFLIATTIAFGLTVVLKYSTIGNAALMTTYGIETIVGSLFAFLYIAMTVLALNLIWHMVPHDFQWVVKAVRFGTKWDSYVIAMLGIFLVCTLPFYKLITDWLIGATMVSGTLVLINTIMMMTESIYLQKNYKLPVEESHFLGQLNSRDDEIRTLKASIGTLQDQLRVAQGILAQKDAKHFAILTAADNATELTKRELQNEIDLANKRTNELRALFKTEVQLLSNKPDLTMVGILDHYVMTLENLDAQRRENQALMALSKGEVWMWQEKHNDLASLTCYVQIHAYDLRKLLEYDKNKMPAGLSQAQFEKAMDLIEVFGDHCVASGNTGAMLVQQAKSAVSNYLRTIN